METARLSDISVSLHRVAGCQLRFADPRELVYAAGYLPVPGGACGDRRIVPYRWNADRRERGLAIATALAFRLAGEVDGPNLIGFLLAPRSLVRLHGFALTLTLQQHAPTWFLRPWIRRHLAVYSRSGTLRAEDLKLLR